MGHQHRAQEYVVRHVSAWRDFKKQAVDTPVRRGRRTLWPQSASNGCAPYTHSVQGHSMQWVCSMRRTPVLAKRTCSAHGTASTTISASLTADSFREKKCTPSAACAWIALTTAGWLFTQAAAAEAAAAATQQLRQAGRRARISCVPCTYSCTCAR